MDVNLKCGDAIEEWECERAEMKINSFVRMIIDEKKEAGEKTGKNNQTSSGSDSNLRKLLFNR